MVFGVGWGLKGCRSKYSLYDRRMVESGFSSSVNERQVGEVSYEGGIPSLSFQFLFSGGFNVLT